MTESTASSVGHHLHRAAKYDGSLTLQTLMENLEEALPKLGRPQAGAAKGGACGDEGETITFKASGEANSEPGEAGQQ